MSQQLLTLPLVTPTVENWDAQLQSVIASFKGALRAFRISLTAQGDITIPSVISIQLVDYQGRADIHEQVNVRIRACIQNTLLRDSSVTLGVLVGTSVIVLGTAPINDLVIQSNAIGLIQISCTCLSIDSFDIRLGHYMTSPFADYSIKRTVSHTNPNFLFNSVGAPIFNSLGARLVRG